MPRIISIICFILNAYSQKELINELEVTMLE
jgi:hypothetical protein